MRQYQELLEDILTNGTDSGDRTGTGTRKVSGRMLKFNLQDGFPLVTTKRMFFRGIALEMMWFISGETNIRPLVLDGVNIWNEWPYSNYLMSNGTDPKTFRKLNPEAWRKGIADFAREVAVNEDFANKWGELGPVYGYQWRHWRNPDGSVIDQLGQAIDTIRSNPNSRRIIVNAWNPSDIPKMEISGLPPCHMMYQFFVAGDRLSMVMYQRSVDSFLGLPFNIASYALLNDMVAHVTGLKSGELTLFLGDTHIYLNHMEQVREQLTREPYPLPKLSFTRKVESIDDFTYEDILLEGYKHHPAIKGEISV